MFRAVPRARIEGLLAPDRGLTQAEVAERRARHGANEIVETQRSGWTALARETARDPMLWFLVGVGVLFAAAGERGEAATLLVALVPLVGMDAWLHHRTRASTRGLASGLATIARVLRDGTEMEVPSTDLVPGDLAVVVAGEPFPADGVFVGGEGLHAEESALTGEAWPVPKEVLRGWSDVAPEPRVDSRHWGSAGTRLLTGRAKLRVVYTGGETLYGEIVRSAVGGRHARTPLQVAIGRLVGFLVAAAAVACLVLACVRMSQGHGLLDALLSALSLAIAAMPEEFPVVFAVFLGTGVYRLARRRALVRRAVAVENIGRVTSICCDKTGTITHGRLRLAAEEPAAGMDPARLRLLAAIASPPEGADPLNATLAEGAPAASMLPRVASFPFTEGRRRETVVVLERPGVFLAAVKGAPEAILPATTLDAEAREDWLHRAEGFARDGYKVIACASREMEDGAWAGGEPDRGFELAGLLALEDPVRSGVADAVRRVQEAGIRVVMVTGDHPESGRAIAKRIGLGSGEPAVILGEELERRLQADRSGTAIDFDVVARALPAQKLALVRALQARGEIVSVTGDGVNDVPALQAADVSIAMGERGTRSAREVAAIVLLDDDFSTITSAIAEGRRLFENLRKSFAYLLAIHAPFVLSAALIPLAGFPLLYLPVHVVWLELVIHPTALLVFQEESRATELRRIGTGTTGLFDLGGWFAIVVSGTTLTVFVLWGYVRSGGEGLDVEHARAMALATLNSGSAALAAALSLLATRTARTIVAATLLLSVLFVQTPVIAARLHLRPLDLDDGLAALAAGALAALPVLIWTVRRR